MEKENSKKRKLLYASLAFPPHASCAFCAMLPCLSSSWEKWWSGGEWKQTVKIIHLWAENISWRKNLMRERKYLSDVWWVEGGVENVMKEKKSETHSAPVNVSFCAMKKLNVICLSIISALYTWQHIFSFLILYMPEEKEEEEEKEGKYMLERK